MPELTLAELQNSTQEQAAVMGEALRIYGERNAKYQDLWKQYGARDQVLHVRSKFLRVRQGLDGEATEEEIVEDALDGINYFAMIIRNVREGRRGTKVRDVPVPWAMVEKLSWLFSGDCRIDHDGVCQQHNMDDCVVPLLRMLLKEGP